jgi:hypothetical protein
MRKLVSVAIVLAVGVVAWGQLWPDFKDYPGGHLLMTYRITLAEGESYSYTIELVPGSDPEVYTVRTEISGPARVDDLSNSPYLLFAWEPAIWFGNSWWLSFYFGIFLPGQPIAPHNTYVLPGGFSFVTEDYIEVAGVKAIKGIFSSLQDPDRRVIMAISPDPAVPYPVLIREESRVGGDWKLDSEMVLTKYQHGS